MVMSKKKINDLTRAHRRYVHKPPEDQKAQNILADEMLAWVTQNDVYAL